MAETAAVKPGQKFPTPTPGFGDRVFYETLLRQRPDSAMAQEWCVNYGVLPTKKAAKLHAIVMDRKKKQRVGGMQSSSSSSAPPKKKKAKIVKEEAVDTELQLPGGEGLASAAL
ncbi:unnamed protein product [Cylindrotheca closterium]|uniref:Uncharacterized protein n=1 Tax=Cylindrotheca closterium TaxID=2856 RepID=A0AAD2FLR8_9STRA|nr:unnamed protein product [Cylindrotheca closterium]